MRQILTVRDIFKMKNLFNKDKGDKKKEEFVLVRGHINHRSQQQMSVHNSTKNKLKRLLDDIINNPNNRVDAIYQAAKDEFNAAQRAETFQNASNLAMYIYQNFERIFGKEPSEESQKQYAKLCSYAPSLGISELTIFIKNHPIKGLTYESYTIPTAGTNNQINSYINQFTETNVFNPDAINRIKDLFPVETNPLKVFYPEVTI